MKKFTLLILGCATALIASAQTTITNLDVNIGDLIVMENDTITTLNIGSTGSGKNWDFSFLAQHEKDSVMFESTTGKMKSDEYPDADFVVLDDHDSTVIYLDKTSAHLKVIGFVELDANGDTNVLNYKMPFLTFPASMGTSASEMSELGGYQDTLFFDPDGSGPHPFVDSFRISQTLYIETVMDAEGNLQMPKGDFNVLRQVKYNIFKTKIWMYANNNWVTMSDTLRSLFGGLDSISIDTNEYEVRFWTNDPAAKFSLVSFKLDSATHSINNDVIEWLDIAPTPANGIESKGDIVNNVYPIPAQNQVVVTLKNMNDDYDYEIITITGNVLSTGKLNQQFNQISTQELSKGTYLLKVNSNTTSEVIKLIKN